MQQVMLFENEEFGQLRMIFIDGKQYFMASDVAKALGYVRPNDAVSQHCRATVKHSIPISGKEQEVNFIPEGDVYRLIIRSKLPKAEEFEKWVFDEVLPSIRKTGGYIQETNPYSIKEIVKETIYQVVPEIIRELEDKEERNKRAEREMKKLEAKTKRRIERLLYSEKYSYYEISKLLGQEEIDVSAEAICFYAQNIGL